MGFPYKRIGSSPTTAGADGGVFDKFDNYYAEQNDQIGKTAISAEGSGITATGGTITEITQHGLTWKVHTFTGSGTFSVSAVTPVPASPTDIAGKVEYLVVAGGGSGPNGNGGGAGGGGAGGYRANVGQISPTPEASGGGETAEAAFPVSASPGSYTVTIGAGGAYATGTRANNGNDSVFGSITSTGGGAGNCSHPGGANPGGSGGGGGEFNGPQAAGGSATSGQGYAGGTGCGPSPTNCGAGGGGAAAVGGNGDSTNGGTAARNGGEGVPSSIDGTATYRAGGGGASGNNRTGGNGGEGGGGGGGAGSGGPGQSPEGFSGGTANTGGGGGARYDAPTGQAAGGSGIVIVRYVK